MAADFAVVERHLRTGSTLYLPAGPGCFTGNSSPPRLTAGATSMPAPGHGSPPRCWARISFRYRPPPTRKIRRCWRYGGRATLLLRASFKRGLTGEFAGYPQWNRRSRQ